MTATSPSDACLAELGTSPRTILYRNPLRQPEDLAGWRMEGPGACSFPLGRLRMESTADPSLRQRANFVHWCPETFPDDIRISWDFRPIREPGLAICFFAAVGHGGVDVLHPSLAPRSGPYDQYHHGDIDALHVSYFRRSAPDEVRFQTCNLRKSHGFHLVAQGGDPLPSSAQASGSYRIAVIKSGADVRFCIDHLTVFAWRDDGSRGAVLGGGHIGFRQMAPLIAEYGDLVVESLAPH